MSKEAEKAKKNCILRVKKNWNAEIFGRKLRIEMFKNKKLSRRTIEGKGFYRFKGC